MDILLEHAQHFTIHRRTIMKLDEIQKLIASQDTATEQKRMLREVELLMRLHNAKDSADVMSKITAIRIEETHRD